MYAPATRSATPMCGCSRGRLSLWGLWPMGTCVPSAGRPHHYFDKLYTSGRMTKQEAYRWLANFLQAPQSQAHIGYLGEYTCRQVLQACKELLGRGGAKAS